MRSTSDISSFSSSRIASALTSGKLHLFASSNMSDQSSTVESYNEYFLTPMRVIHENLVKSRDDERNARTGYRIPKVVFRTRPLLCHSIQTHSTRMSLAEHSRDSLELRACFGNMMIPVRKNNDGRGSDNSRPARVELSVVEEEDVYAIQTKK